MAAIWQFPTLLHLATSWRLAPSLVPHANFLLALKRYSTDEPVSFFAPMSQILFWTSVAGAAMFCMGFRWMRFWREIQDTPFSKMASASMGLVEVSGRATGPRTIKAALTGADCLYYRAMAWQRRPGESESHWKQAADEKVCVPFFVEDGTGKLLVQPEGAQMEVRQTLKKDFDARFYRGGDSLPEPVRDFAARNGLDNAKDLRVEEHCIKPGETLFVFGTLGESRGMLSWDARRHFGQTRMVQIQLNGPVMLGSKTSWRISAPKGGGPWITTRVESIQNSALSPEIASVLEQAATSGKSTVLINRFLLNKKEGGTAGGADAATAQATLPEGVLREIERVTGGAVTSEQIKEAMRNAQEGVSVTTESPEPAEELPKVAIREGGRREPFIISWKSQREVISNMQRKASVCVWGGPVVAVAALFFLLMLLGKIPVSG